MVERHRQEKIEVPVENLFQCNFVHLKSHMNWPETAAVLPLWADDNWLS